MQRVFTQVTSLRPKLEKQVRQVAKAFADSKQNDWVALILIGSASEGQATYRSDLDFLVIVSPDRPLNYGQVVAWRDELERLLAKKGVDSTLPCQFNFVKDSVRHSVEPAMRQALAGGLVLFSVDPLWPVTEALGVA